VSLILEALKKLEREKEGGGERGFVVLSHLPWSGRRSGRVGVVWAAFGVLVVGALAGAGWGLRHGRSGSPPSVAVSTPRTPAASLLPATAATAPTPAPPLPTPEVRSRPAPARPAEAPDVAPVAIGAAPLVAPVATPPEPPVTMPHEETSGAPHELRLNAISVKDGHPIAILNDRLVREGDSFDGIRVLRIGEAEVEVEVAGERRTLRF
jgi:hypothetical protein